MVAKFHFIVLLLQHCFVWSKNDHTHLTTRCYRLFTANKICHSQQNIPQHYYLSDTLVYKLSPVLTSDTRISINISIRSLCASEDSRNISISISFFLMLMLMLMFSEDIVDISISTR